ncbi:organic cation transporter protein-like [Mizuhopecten yessoensis]|uniref:Solute carrier family 22 member 6-A n=2 Tax=Mizuhopecten yessoensis TaxID=6573 RepID=A0A210PRZ2_MIZYE|nr:organic cation transporter protein-like [Mizuhopecten yessoensis]OWF39251.1 Solute carrier family 22 member 6-A [Mizuhopecten yessoensis]
MSSTSAYLEGLIDECGGFSKFQFMLFSVVMISKLSPTWSMLMMTFAGAVPDWYCMYETSNRTFANISSVFRTSLNDADFLNSSFQQCQPPANATADKCMEFRFEDNMNTVVNEWTLVCDKDSITSTIITIQMAGLLISGVTAGHMADIIGRKPTFFLSLVIMIILNVCEGFSVSWEMFAILRFFLGFGIGCYLTVFYNFLIEFTPAKFRPMVVAIPSWALCACVFGFVSMWLHDWKYLHFATAILTAPWLLTWWVIPESFRYLVSHNRIDEAEDCIRRMARFNGRPVPDLKRLRFLAEEDMNADEKKYTIKDLVMDRTLLKHSLLLGVGWFSCGYGYYAISFGVQSLSGNLYLNMFLLSAVEVPAQMSNYFLTNKFGRKRTTSGLLLLGGLSGLVVAAAEISDLDIKDQLINGFALAAKLCVASGWASLMLLTTETYPTVVRNIGFGLHNSISRVGAMIAPKIVYLNTYTPGLMYFLFGGVMITSALCILLVLETKGKHMQDLIKKDTEKGNTAPNNELPSIDKMVSDNMKDQNKCEL